MTYPNTNKAIKDFDDYNTVVKTHTVKIGDMAMVCEEVRSGHIKVEGDEQFSSFDEMKANLMDGATIETIEL